MFHLLLKIEHFDLFRVGQNIFRLSTRFYPSRKKFQMFLVSPNGHYKCSSNVRYFSHIKYSFSELHMLTYNFRKIKEIVGSTMNIEEFLTNWTMRQVILQEMFLDIQGTQDTSFLQLRMYYIV